MLTHDAGISMCISSIAPRTFLRPAIRLNFSVTLFISFIDGHLITSEEILQKIFTTHHTQWLNDDLAKLNLSLTDL